MVIITLAGADRSIHNVNARPLLLSLTRRNVDLVTRVKH